MKPCKITVDLYNTFRERMPEYVQYDRNVPLEITVLENGKPADLNGLFGRLLVSKPDGHEVYSNDVEISGNVITTILGEQIFTASGVAQVTVDILDEQNSKRALIPFGMRIRSAVITDESIKSSNDYQTITALISDVRALDAMFHVEQEQRAEAFNAQMQSQEATFTEAQRQFLADHREAMLHVEQQMTEQANMFHVEQTKRAKAFEQSEADREQRFEAQTTEWAQTVEQAEATRQFNEERRQSAENTRGSAEKARESAERQRVDTEAVRQRQEQERGQGEAGRATAEANRVKAEQTRVDNESSRKSAESSRVNAESQRATAESHRVTAETSRANAESQRATAETNRAGAEGRRSEAESNRVTAENNRATAESKRVTAENTRETQENARREAEEDRATRMAQWEAKAEETAQKAQEAVDDAQAFVNVNEAKLLGPNDKKDYMGNSHESVKEAMDSNVDWLLGEINTVHYDGQHITATDTIEGRSKSAILKGNTETIIDKFEQGTINTWNGTSFPKPDSTTRIRLKNIIELKQDIIIGVNDKYELSVQTSDKNVYGWSSQISFTNNGAFIIAVRKKDGSEIVPSDILGADFNINIPHFTDMQSVKMPVLTTTGKNLFRGLYSDFNQDGWGSFKYGNMGEYYTVSIYDKDTSVSLDGISFGISVKGDEYNTLNWITNGNTVYINSLTTNNRNSFTIQPNNEEALNKILQRFNIQIEEGSTATSYEPYKSNILSCNEDVALRGIGDVQDTLDCLTGELTERIGEIVLDGSEERWELAQDRTNTMRFNCYSLNIPYGINGSLLKTDKLPYQSPTIGDQEGAVMGGGTTPKVVSISIMKTKLPSSDIDGFKQWLSQNPITLQYQLANESVKTVDLSDNHVYSYKGTTHYDCSSAEGSLVPTLSIDVPTNLPAVVTRQRATIQELEKENQELAHAVTIVDEHREEGDLELLSSDFDFELRLMEIEFAIGIPMMANYKGVRNMARTPYDMAKALILGGKYEREEMIAKLDRFEKLGSITADQKAELIALMDAVELTQ